MFRLVVISVLASVVAVQCGTILTPVVGKLVSERVIEAHGSNVVHPSPLVAAAVSPALLRYADSVALLRQPVAGIVARPVEEASPVVEKTIEAHGHQVIHDARPLITVARPLVESHLAVPTIAARELLQPIYYSTYPRQLTAERTVSSYGHSVQHA